jgi:hypothetical protein
MPEGRVVDSHLVWGGGFAALVIVELLRELGAGSGPRDLNPWDSCQEFAGTGFAFSLVVYG